MKPPQVQRGRRNQSSRTVQRWNAISIDPYWKVWICGIEDPEKPEMGIQRRGVVMKGDVLLNGNRKEGHFCGSKI